MAEIRVIQGPDRGKSWLLDPVHSTTLGRHTDNTICLTDPRVSRSHITLQPSPVGVQLLDLKSGNGTFINTQPVHSCLLQHLDRIEIGDTILEFLTTNDSTLQLPEIVEKVPDDEGSRLLTRAEGTEWLKQRLATLSVLYEATTATSQILDVDELMDRIIRLLIDTTSADHGRALLLDDETGQILPRGTLTRDAPMTVSRTIVDYVLKNRAGVLVRDALHDSRFESQDSIMEQKLRQVICVPMKGRHGTVGVIFLDRRSGPGRFASDHLQLAIAVAHQAALAVEESRYYDALLQSERMAAIGQTITSLSHHIKNIMQGIRFGSDLVRQALAEQQETEPSLLSRGWKLVEKNQAKIDQLILDMLNFAKAREPIRETTPMATLIQEVVHTVQGRITELQIQLEIEAQEKIVLHVDPMSIQNALLNILSNAIDALEQVEENRRHLTIVMHKTETECHIVITDSGEGIPESDWEDIFRPFVSSKGARGTGLGLPSALKSIREHGGNILVSNHPEGGAEFIVILPIDSAATP